jgi:hypothetical protein
VFGVYRSFSLPDVMHFRNLLEARGIACHVRNYHSASVLGELPFLEVELARRVIATAGVPQWGGARDWTCPGCGEKLEAQFAQCWRCGTEGPTWAER